MNKSSLDQFSLSSVQNGKYYLLLFLIWPFLALIAALINYNRKESKVIVYLFLIYYGLTFVLGNAGNDAERYALYMRNNSALPFSDFFKIVGGIYASDTSVDIVEPLISFFVSRFTSYHGALFAVYAAIFGYFYLKSVNLLYESQSESSGWNSIIFLTGFIVVLPITAINGFRMWTAAWIFFYGAYHVVLYRDPKFLLVALSSSLVHFSFLSANLILIIYFFAGNRNLVYLPIVLASFILPHLIAPVFQSISLKMGGGLQSRFETYSNESYILATQEVSRQAAWFLNLGTDLLFYYLLFAVAVIKLRFNYLMKEKVESNLYSFLLLFLAFVNFGSGIPSFGDRFMIVFFLFATFYVFLFFLKIPGNKIHWLALVGLFPMLLRTVVAFRQGSESMNAWIFSPGLGVPLFVPDLSLFEMLFQ